MLQLYFGLLLMIKTASCGSLISLRTDCKVKNGTPGAVYRCLHADYTRDCHYVLLSAGCIHGGDDDQLDGSIGPGKYSRVTSEVNNTDFAF